MIREIYRINKAIDREALCLKIHRSNDLIVIHSLCLSIEHLNAYDFRFFFTDMDNIHLLGIGNLYRFTVIDFYRHCPLGFDLSTVSGKDLDVKEAGFCCCSFGGSKHTQGILGGSQIAVIFCRSFRDLRCSHRCIRRDLGVCSVAYRDLIVIAGISQFPVCIVSRSDKCVFVCICLAARADKNISFCRGLSLCFCRFLCCLFLRLTDLFRVGFFLSGLEYIFFPSLEEICLTCVCYFFKVSPICFISIRRLIRRKDVFLCAVNILDCCFFLRDYNDDTIIIGFFLVLFRLRCLALGTLNHLDNIIHKNVFILKNRYLILGFKITVLQNVDHFLSLGSLLFDLCLICRCLGIDGRTFPFVGQKLCCLLFFLGKCDENYRADLCQAEGNLTDLPRGMIHPTDLSRPIRQKLSGECRTLRHNDSSFRGELCCICRDIVGQWSTPKGEGKFYALPVCGYHKAASLS